MAGQHFTTNFRQLATGDVCSAVQKIKSNKKLILFVQKGHRHRHNDTDTPTQRHRHNDTANERHHEAHDDNDTETL